MRPHRLRRVLLVLVASLEVVAATGVIGLRWMTSSSEASLDEALQRFRESRTASSPGADVAAPTATAVPQATPAPAPARQAARRAATPVVGPVASAAAVDPMLSLTGRPDEGVYLWRTHGTETIAGATRELPEQSIRTVAHGQPGAWTERTEYSAQHIEELDLLTAPEGFRHSRYGIQLSFGPMTETKSMTIDPPMFHATFPFAVGQRWNGTWSGQTSGTYTGETLERTILRIGGEDVEVWVTNVVSQFEGEMRGDMELRLWISPRHRMAVKEIWDITASEGPGTYGANWTTTLTSTRPRR